MSMNKDSQENEAAKLVVVDMNHVKDDDGSLWVVNRTEPRGVIVLSVHDGINGKTAMTIPSTWIPVDLTTQAVKTALVKNPDFRRLVMSGKVEIVTEESAVNFMNTVEGAKDEAVIVYGGVTRSLQGNAQVKTLTEEDEVDGLVLNIINSTTMTEDQVLTALRARTNLKPSDYRYILANSQHGKVKEFAAKNLNIK